MSKQVYLNNKFIPRNQAKVSIFDRGFLYGDGLFETMRVYSGGVFRLDRHLERLFQSAGEIKLQISLNVKEIEKAIYELIERNNLKDAYVRLSVWRGEGIRGISKSRYLPSNVAIWGEPFTPYSKATYGKGFKAVVVATRRNEWSPLSRIKSMNFLNNILARIEAEERGVDEGILLNSQGFVAEGTVGNLFLVSKGILLTPCLGAGVLPGITREAVLELAPGLGLERAEHKIRLPRLLKSEEAFLTNSLMEIMPLTALDGKPIGKGKPGSITRLLHREYKKLIERETSSLRSD